MANGGSNYNLLYKAALSVTYKQLTSGTQYSFNELNRYLGISCTTTEQQQAGQKYAAWAKKNPHIVEIICEISPLIYKKK